MPCQQIGTLTDDGNPAQTFDCPRLPVPPDVGICWHAAAGQTGVPIPIPDTALPEVDVHQPGPPGQVYGVVGRWNHSRVTRGFQAIAQNIGAGVSSFVHGLGAVPDMFYAVNGDPANIQTFVVTAIDDTQVYVENFGIPCDILVYCWLLHSEDTPVATSPAIDVSLVAGAAAVDVPHGLGHEPDVLLINKYQAPAGLQPAGECLVCDVDETNLNLQSSAGAGNNLNLRIFAQRTYSIQE